MYAIRSYYEAQAASDSHLVYMGAADDTALVMRFIRPTVRIKAGESVTFDMAMNSGIPVPHTVTFGTEPVAPSHRSDRDKLAAPPAPG